MKTIKSLSAACLFMLAMSCSKENLQKQQPAGLQSVSEEDAALPCYPGNWIGIYANGYTPGENYDMLVYFNEALLASHSSSGGNAIRQSKDTKNAKEARSSQRFLSALFVTLSALCVLPSFCLRVL